MEEVLRYINEAQYYIDSFRDISLADSFFEESEMDKEINKDNEKAKTGALASLKKAFGKLVDLVKKLYNNVKEFFAQKFMNKEDKKRFNEFKALVKSMPEYSKVKVTIEDFRAYEKAFNEAEKELESASKKEDFNETIANGIIDRLNKALNNMADKATGLGKKAVLETTLSTALDIADRDALAAKAIDVALETEIISLEEIEKELGAKEAAKFEKKIKKYARDSIFHRAKVRIFYRKTSTLQAVLKKQVKTIMSYTNIKDGKLKEGKLPVDRASIAKGVLQHPVKTSKIVGDPATKTFTKAVGDLASTTADVIHKNYEYDKTKRQIKDAKKFFSFKSDKKKK